MLSTFESYALQGVCFKSLGFIETAFIVIFIFYYEFATYIFFLQLMTIVLKNLSFDGSTKYDS